MGTTWADVSQYQGIPVDDSYPHRVLCFRTNTGDTEDTLGVENARRAKALLDAGRLDLVIGYYFFWPGQANCDLHRDVLERAGLWGHPLLGSMVDVEGAPKNGVKRVRGDQSAEVSDEIARLRGWFGDDRRIVGYWNPRADPELWTSRPPGLRLVIPQYGRTPGDLGSIAQPIRGEAFAHQFTESGSCAPWPVGVDLNFSPLPIDDLLSLFGVKEGNTMSDVVTEGAGQLHPFAGKIRQIRHPEHVNSSTRSPEAPWPADTWYDLWNETVWDGFTLPAQLLDDDAQASLLGWSLDTNKRLRLLEEKLDAVLAAVTGR